MANNSKVYCLEPENPTTETSYNLLKKTNDSKILKKKLGKVYTNGDVYRSPDGNTIYLSGNKDLIADNAIILEKINISGSNNTIAGYPKFKEKIVLTDSDSQLKLDLSCKLNQNIVLNDGSLILENDLYLKDNVTLEGNGVLDVNNFSFVLPVNKAKMTGKITFKNANDVQLAGYTTMSGTWSFYNSENVSVEPVSNLNGYGCILDISGGGCIEVGPGHTLYINSVVIKGLGSGKGFFNINPTGNIKLSNTVLQLNGNFNLTSGILSVIGPNCKMTTSGEDKMIITGTQAKFCVDGVIFVYESLSNAPVWPVPFMPINGGVLSVLNNGIIMSPQFDNFKGEHVIAIPASMGTNYIKIGVDMNSQTIVHFKNIFPNSITPIVLDCTNKRIRYDLANPKSIVLDPGVHVTVKNLLVDSWDFSKVDLQGTGTMQSTFAFGENVFFQMGGDMSVNDLAINFVGNAIVQGNGYNFILNIDNALTVSDNKTLVIKNTNLKIKTRNALKPLSDNATMIFENCSIELTDVGVNLNQGCFKFVGENKITSNKKIVQTCDFTFCSKGSFAIDSKSSLNIKKDVNFIFSPEAKDGETSYDTKRRLTFYDDSSNLRLKQCTMDINHCGLALSKGILEIDGDVKFLMDHTSPGKELELSDDLFLKVNKNSTIEVNGQIIKSSNSW